jgi:hypothetical protein
LVLLSLEQCTDLITLSRPDMLTQSGHGAGQSIGDAVVFENMRDLPAILGVCIDPTP